MLLVGIAIFFAVRNFGEAIPDLRHDAGASQELQKLETGATSAKPLPLLLHVLATLAAVIALGFLLGRFCRYLGQPPVIGEVIAGILLGPSLLGAISPDAMHLLIPSPGQDPKGQVTAALKAIAQLGVILYLFLVGLELNGAKLTSNAHSFIAISHASIVVPFVLGAALALLLFPEFAQPGKSFTSFSLFLGAALAVTAFPVLARILADSKMERTEIGILALGCAAADDVTAWCLLAFVVGVAEARIEEGLIVSAGAAAFIAAMFLLAKPVLKRWADTLDRRSGDLPASAIAILFFLVLACAFTTEWIGVHAVFGAFLLGAVIPHESKLAKECTGKLHDPVTVLLLPAFFALAGLRTELGLLSNWQDWLFVFAITAVASIGKIGGTFSAARVAGQSTRDAAVLGALMNTRGLMGLIVLDIGLEMGILSRPLFTIMVLMALATTVATAPLVKWLMKPRS